MTRRVAVTYFRLKTAVIFALKCRFFSCNSAVFSLVVLSRFRSHGPTSDHVKTTSLRAAIGRWRSHQPGGAAIQEYEKDGWWLRRWNRGFGSCAPLRTHALLSSFRLQKRTRGAAPRSNNFFAVACTSPSKAGILRSIAPEPKPLPRRLVRAS